MASAISPLVEEQKEVFSNLPHKNPFYDIGNAIRYVVPLNVSYSQSVKSSLWREERDFKVRLIEKAYQQLIHRQNLDLLFVQTFHRLSVEFLKDYASYMLSKQINALVSPRGKIFSLLETAPSALVKPEARDLILKQEVGVYAYFDNFYWMSQEYLRRIKEEKRLARSKNGL